jgi:hypothetical protein
MLRKPIVLYWIISSLLYLQVANAQCPIPASPPISTLTDPLITNGETIGTGSTKWYKSTGSINSLTLKGGTLIVDGNLSINTLNIESGEIYIMPGASLTLSGNQILKSNTKIFNYGTFDVNNGHIYMMGPTTSATPTCLINVTPSATISSPFDYLYISDPNSRFINNGKAVFGAIQTTAQAASGSVVLNDGSETTVLSIFNDKENAFDVPGNACVSVRTGNSSVSKKLTSSSSLKLALASSTGPSCNSCMASPWGNAIIFPGAPSCASITPLPVQLSNFNIKQESSCHVLTWNADASNEQIVFIVERSTNAVSFNEIIRFSQQTNNQYQYKDCAPANGTNYYRVKQLNLSTGKVAYSEILSNRNKGIVTTSIYPNPFTNQFTVSYIGKLSSNSTWFMRNSMGQNINITVHKHGQSFLVNTIENISAGVYFFQLTTDTGTYKYSLVKK